MCDKCGCTPCKCGGMAIDGICEGCSKPAEECTCEGEE